MIARERIRQEKFALKFALFIRQAESKKVWSNWLRHLLGNSVLREDKWLNLGGGEADGKLWWGSSIRGTVHRRLSCSSSSTKFFPFLVRQIAQITLFCLAVCISYIPTIL